MGIKYLRTILLFAAFFVLLSGFSSAARLPLVNGDTSAWGTVLNDFLNISLSENGTLRSSTVNSSQIVDNSITGTDILNTTNITVANITIGHTVTFALGQYIDSLVAGMLRIIVSFNITANLSVGGTVRLGSFTNIATGIGSVAMGANTSAIGNYSTAMGVMTTASADYTTAMGFNTTASKTKSTAIGDSSIADGAVSVAIGDHAAASGFGSIAIGKGVNVSGTNSVGIALNNQAGTEVSQANTMAVLGGKVGINITNPTGLFVVNGNSNITGDSYAATRSGGAIDVAEWIKADGALEAGDVVVIDGSVDNKVKLSTFAYDTAVAGVVSTKPHLLMGEEYKGTDAVMLAVAGRVPVKVVVENGPIRRGDLLTTSRMPGYAMRCDDRLKCAGAIVGKALEPLETGKGKIMALISLG